MKHDVWYYRTEIVNDAAVPVRMMWFEFYYSDGGTWHGVNARNAVLQTGDFVRWFSDGSEPPKDGWLQPGQTCVCDPNWHLAFGDSLVATKWAYLAVDHECQAHFAEAMVERDAVELYRRQPEEMGSGYDRIRC
jgi:hypothetical protein